jgi:hypothetical protein
MKKHYLFRQYAWLVETIRRAGKITLTDINNKWVDCHLSDGIPMSRSTFTRHREAIESMFGINIECDPHDGYSYYIENTDELSNGDAVQSWMFKALSTSNLLSESLSLRDRILTEPVNGSNEMLETVLQAMRDNIKVRVFYKKYGAAEARELLLAPYALKMYRQRWYLVGVQEFAPNERHPDWLFTIGTFAFDRIVRLELTDQHFEMLQYFDAREYFSDCFSIVHGDNTEPTRIVVRAFGNERFYMNGLPWHHSQTLIGEGDDWADYEFFMRPTIDFSNHVMGRGRLVRILEPQWLADEVYSMLLDAAEQYHPEAFANDEDCLESCAES